MEEKERRWKKLIGNRQFYARVITILVPIIVQNTVTNVVSLLDNVMVGRVGTLPMSAVAIVNQLLFVFYLSVFGSLAGSGIFAAQFAGAKDQEGVRHCFRMKNYIALAMLAVALGVFLLIPRQLIQMYFSGDTSPADASATMEYAMGYLRVMLIGLVPFSLSQVYGSTLREIGETKVPMIASVIAIAVNLVFNYILIFGNEGLSFLPFAPMGVVGAAIATVLARFTEAIVIVVYVHSHSRRFAFIRGAYRGFRVPKALCLRIAAKGLPLLANEFLWSFGMAMLMQCYSVRGLDVVAASNISTTANNLFNVVFISMGNAIAIILGQMLGAGETEKAKITVWRLLSLSVATCAVMGSAMLLAAPYIPRIYNTTDQVRAMAKGFLYVVALMMPVYAFNHGSYFTLRSGGKTLITMLFDSVYTWVIAIPAAYCLAHFTDLPIVPLYALVQMLEIIKALIGFVMIKKGIWIQKIVHTPDAAEKG